MILVLKQKCLCGKFSDLLCIEKIAVRSVTAEVIVVYTENGRANSPIDTWDVVDITPLHDPITEGVPSSVEFYSR